MTTKTTAAPAQNTTLCSKHYEELIQKRGLNPDWVRANCRSVSMAEATEAIGYSSKSAGLIIQGTGWQVQFKPDKLWISDSASAAAKADRDKEAGRKKAPRYRSPKEYEGDYDAILPSHPDIKDYWHNLEALKARCWQEDEKPYIVITEGAFKAIAGCSNGIPTICLLGVEMGLTSAKADPQGKRYLVPSLERLARAGFNFIIAFDADCAENGAVLDAEKKLTHQLKKFGVDCLSITGDWKVEEGKGMDDFIQQNGIEAFREKLAHAWDRSNIEEDEGTESKKKAVVPPVDVCSARIAELYRDKLAYESEYHLWRYYGAKHDGCWSIATIQTVRGLVHSYLRSLPGSPPFNAGYVSSVVTTLESDLEVEEWNECKDLLPLRDGVLDLHTKELKEHSPGYRFTWQLPFKWADKGIGCDPIEEFLLKITGNSDIAEVLLCYLSAIVTRRCDLQRYLELIGGGGTGKSTYMKLAKALAGDENAVSSRLSLLESNQFETAKFYRKLLVLFPDSERWQGEVSVLKRLTGEDPIPYERKGVQQCHDYVYEGMVILSANDPPESSDKTSGQERRKLTVGLEKRIPEYEGRDLIKEFQSYLPGLLKRVLDIPRNRVTALIKHTDKNVPALAQKKWSQLIETNTIAAWVDDCCVISDKAKAYIGKDDPTQVGRWLYANYCQYQKESGHKGALPLKRFSSNLRDLLKNQMKVKIFEGRDRNGAFIEGIGLRCFYDPNGTYYHRPLTGTSSTLECDGFGGECDGTVMAETLGSVECDECDGYFDPFKNLEEKEATENFVEPTISAQPNPPVEPSHPSHPALPTVPVPSNPSHNPSQPQLTQPEQPVDPDLEGWSELDAIHSYPNPKSDNLRSSQKRAVAIRDAYKGAKCKADLSALRKENGGEYSKQEHLWVQAWLRVCFPSEYASMLEKAATEQLSLLDVQPQKVEAEQPPESQLEQLWQVGQNVVVELAEDDMRSLHHFNGRTGVVIGVNPISEQCLVDFGNDEATYIPCRGLKLEF